MPTCFLCSDTLVDLKKLKFHIMLKHSAKNVCLFCVDKKGWSDEFKSQLSYREHYKTFHSGLIERRSNLRILEEKHRLGKNYFLLL